MLQDLCLSRCLEKLKFPPRFSLSLPPLMCWHRNLLNRFLCFLVPFILSPTRHFFFAPCFFFNDFMGHDCVFDSFVFLSLSLGHQINKSTTSAEELLGLRWKICYKTLFNYSNISSNDRGGQKSGAEAAANFSTLFHSLRKFANNLELTEHTHRCRVSSTSEEIRVRSFWNFRTFQEEKSTSHLKMCLSLSSNTEKSSDWKWELFDAFLQEKWTVKRGNAQRGGWIQVRVGC